MPSTEDPAATGQGISSAAEPRALTARSRPPTGYQRWLHRHRLWVRLGLALYLLLMLALIGIDVHEGRALLAVSAVCTLIGGGGGLALNLVLAAKAVRGAGPDVWSGAT